MLFSIVSLSEKEHLLIMIIFRKQGFISNASWITVTGSSCVWPFQKCVDMFQNKPCGVKIMQWTVRRQNETKSRAAFMLPDDSMFSSLLTWLRAFLISTQHVSVNLSLSCLMEADMFTFISTLWGAALILWLVNWNFTLIVQLCLCSWWKLQQHGQS